MKIFNKNTTSIFFMSVSLLLLTGFSAFWLFKSFQEQKNILQKEIDNTFEKTIAALQDSVIQNQILKPIKMKKAIAKKNRQKPNTGHFEAKSMTFEPKRAIFFSDSSQSFYKSDTSKNAKVSIVLTKGSRMDSLSSKVLSRIFTKIPANNSIGSIMIKIDSTSFKGFNFDTKDSIKIMHKQTFMGSLKEKKIPKPSEEASVNLDSRKTRFTVDSADLNYTITITYDSLKKSEVANSYSKALAKNKIDLVFSLSENSKRKKKELTNQLRTNEKNFGMPPNYYYATFSDFKPYLFKKITSEILFSLFLIGLTTLSFALIYRNLQKQQRLTELKNDFISNITHELKTPISTVSVAIEALSNFNVLQNPTQTKEYLDISKNELNRLSMLVDKVLKMSIFEQKDMVLKQEEIDLKILIETVLSSMKLQFEKFKAQVNFDFVGDNFMLKGDSIHLTNVVYNLLDNALKYSPEPQIEINLTETEAEIEFSVKDNGLGIRKEYQQKVFEKFFRVPMGDIHNIKGYGLGLSYVKKVVEKHLGKISITSEEGKGSEFRVELTKMI